MHWKWTEWESTALYLITHQKFSSHSDIDNARSSRKRDRRSRSTAFGRCTAGQHGETQLLSIWSPICFLYFTQTVTQLDLQYNNIADEGAQHLSSMLQVNTVRLSFSPSHHSSTIFTSYRHSQSWIFNRTKSAVVEHSIWQVQCTWIEWDLTSLHPTTHLFSLFHTDTHNAASSI